MQGAKPMDQQVLSAQLARFNWCPAAYTHPSWIADWIPEQTLNLMRQSQGAREALNSFLLEHHGLLEPAFEDAASSRLEVIFLLPPAQLQNLVHYAGVALSSEKIRKVLCGKQQKKIRETIGNSAFQFALKRAPFMVGSLLHSLRWSSGSDSFDTNPNAREIGLMAFAAASDYLSSAAKDRIKLKLPMAEGRRLETLWEAGSSTYLHSSHDKCGIPSALGSLFVKLSQELLHKWHPDSA